MRASRSITTRATVEIVRRCGGVNRGNPKPVIAVESHPSKNEGWGTREQRFHFYFGITSCANLLATTSRISLRFFPASIMASRDPVMLSEDGGCFTADTLTGDKVVNRQKEDLGKIEYLMIDLETGRIAYAVL